MVLELVIIVAFVASLGMFAFPFLTNPVGALVLWGGVVLLGLLVPLALQWLSRGSRRPAPAVTAAILTLVGGLLLRVAVVLVPQGVFG
jgi:formate-dependent nitrite reductase membrane component NrfD